MEKVVWFNGKRFYPRIALQDPALYLDLYREAGFCLYRLNTAFSLRVGNDFFGIFVDLCQLKVVVLVWYGTRYHTGTKLVPWYHHGTIGTTVLPLVPVVL